MAPSYAPSRDRTFLRAETRSHLFTRRAEIASSYAPSRNHTFLRAEPRWHLFHPTRRYVILSNKKLTDKLYSSLIQHPPPPWFLTLNECYHVQTELFIYNTIPSFTSASPTNYAFERFREIVIFYN